MDITLKQLQDYLFDHYKNGGIDQSLFMKLVEEIGEVAEVLNKKAGRKATADDNLQEQLAGELADVIHYAVAIASLNNIDITTAIVDKDKISAKKYNHTTTLENYVTTHYKNNN